MTAHHHVYSTDAWNFGPHNSQDIHVHSCMIEMTCLSVKIGEGRKCSPASSHYEDTLGKTSRPTTGHFGSRL